MNNKNRSSSSKNSNSLNGLIKKTSMKEKRHHNNAKKLLMATTASAVLLGVIFTIGFGDEMLAFAAKPQKAIDWSNGFPSGPHSTMNIHGKKADYNCNNDLEGTELYGSSVFVPLNDTAQINIVSNKRSDITEGKAVDPCAAPFGSASIDPALYQLPEGEHQVYWRILGKPNNSQNGDGPSEARISSPRIVDQCDFLPVAFADGSIVQSFDPDAVAAIPLIEFNDNEKYVDADSSGNFTSGDSIYRDIGETANKVDAGDTWLYGPMVLDDGTVDLVPFIANEKHENQDLNGQYDEGETVYYSTDAVVSDGDIRLANADQQGLSEDQGGDAVNCEDETLVGLGLINNQGAFEKTEYDLKRFGDYTGKGKSKAVEITDMFLWTGAVCDATILDLWDTDMDMAITIHDFEVGMGDETIEAWELNSTLSIPLADAEILIADVEDAVAADPNSDVDDTNGNGEIDTEAEFAYFLEIQFGSDFNCQAFIDEWVFNVADIVIYGFDYENNGTTLSQMRFYPTATTDFG